MFILIFCFVIGLWQSHAFINIEAIRRTSGDGFLGKSSLKFSGQRGNTNKFSDNVTTLNIYRYPQDEMLLLADYVSSVTSGVKDTNNGRLHLRYTIAAKKPISWEWFTQSEFDEFRNLKWRNIFGSNARYRLVNTKTESVIAGTGLFYEAATYIKEPSRYGYRGNFYLSYVVGINDHASAYSTLYFQPSMFRINDVRLLFESGLSFMMTERLALEVQFNLNYDSRPPVDIVRTDITYLTGFSWKY